MQHFTLSSCCSYDIRLNCRTNQTKCKKSLKAQQFSTWFVGILSHPCDGDASDLRVTESQQEGAVGFGHQHVLGLLLVYKAQDGPAKSTQIHTHFYM